MNIVFISPHFPVNYPQFCHHLHHLGVNVLGIDHVDFDKSSLQSTLKGYCKVNDLNNIEELADACELFMSRHGSIDRVESHNEHWLQTQAELRSRFNIPGMKNTQMGQVKKKSEMKKVFIAAGMEVAKGRLVPTLQNALELAAEIGYPMMAKPDIGVGAYGCQKINNEKELREFFHIHSPQNYFMEEFVEGELCSFDGLADKEGRILFHTAHLNSAGTAEVVNQQLDAYFYSLREIPSDLEKIGRQTVQAFSVKESFFHLEYFRRYRDHRLIPVEVNIRPPGGGALDMCNYACDIDLYREWAHLIAGMNAPLHYERKYHCLTAIRRLKNSYRHTHEEILSNWGKLIVQHEKPPLLHAATMGDYYYMARSPDLEELLSFQKYLQS